MTMRLTSSQTASGEKLFSQVPHRVLERCYLRHDLLLNLRASQGQGRGIIDKCMLFSCVDRFSGLVVEHYPLI